MACAALAAVIDLVFPYVSRMSMMRLLPERMFEAFFAVMAVMIAAYILKGVCYYFITVLGHRMGVYVEADMRRAAFNHIQKLSFSFFDHNRTGAHTRSRVNKRPLRDNRARAPRPGGHPYLLSHDCRRAGRYVHDRVAPGPRPGGDASASYRLHALAPREDEKGHLEVKRKTAEINSAIESGISGIRTAKAFANEKAEDDKFVAANEKYKAARREYFNAMAAL